MFTVRIEQGSEAHIVECAQYTRQDGKDGCTVLTLYPAAGPITQQAPTMTLAVEAGRVFIMNAQGNTVDTVRPPRPVLR